MHRKRVGGVSVNTDGLVESSLVKQLLQGDLLVAHYLAAHIDNTIQSIFAFHSQSIVPANE
jgi:hypothetical protein